MTVTRLCKIVIKALEDLKAFDIRILNVRKLTSITDRMIIASGNSTRQVIALADKIIEAAGEKGIKPLGVEGAHEGDWALIDLGDVIVHVMRPPIREYYQLEKLWSVKIKKRANS
jgi:iojap-like ribosome-associated protein